jgi:hypothetical protein
MTREDERRMKSNGHLERHCLLCEADKLYHRLMEDCGTAGVLPVLGPGPLQRLIGYVHTSG